MIPPYIPYSALLLSVLALWIPCKSKIAWWQIFLFTGFCCGLLTHGITLWGGMALILFYLLVEKYQSSSSTLKNILWGVILVFGLILLMGLSPVSLFYSLPVLTKIQFTPDAIPFTLSFHFSGVAVGVIIIGLTLKVASSLEEWKKLLRQTLVCLPVVIIVLLALSLALGFVRWEPKHPQYLVLWMMSNLFFTCVAEEGFFRGFFQEFLTRTFPVYRVIGIITPALFFGMIHYRGGLAYMFLATVAGMLYGWVYHVTKRIEGSMLAHFALNLTHLLLFTYPALTR